LERHLDAPASHIVARDIWKAIWMRPCHISWLGTHLEGKLDAPISHIVVRDTSGRPFGCARVALLFPGNNLVGHVDDIGRPFGCARVAYRGSGHMWKAIWMCPVSHRGSGHIWKSIWIDPCLVSWFGTHLESHLDRHVSHIVVRDTFERPFRCPLSHIVVRDTSGRPFV
jgi:hypothetical protein